jgi:hypothetical protein
LDRNSIAFLVQQMRLELEGIPQDAKRTPVEEQQQCGEDEFGDARLQAVCKPSFGTVRKSLLTHE